jgi:hypothetical protein
MNMRHRGVAYERTMAKQIAASFLQRACSHRSVVLKVLRKETICLEMTAAEHQKSVVRGKAAFVAAGNNPEAAGRSILRPGVFHQKEAFLQ